MGLFLAFVLSFLPALTYVALVYWIDRYEKEPKALIALAFGWGVVVATAGAIALEAIARSVLQLSSGSEALAEQLGAAIVAPLVEESLKGLAVLLVFWFKRDEFDSVLDGIVTAGIVALGFAATENVLYLYQGYVQNGGDGLLGLFFLRVVMGAWNHPLYTAFIGIGFAFARFTMSRAGILLFPVVGWIAAVVLHATHNSLAVFLDPRAVVLVLLVDWLGWLVMATVIIVCARREGRLVASELLPESEAGTITRQQYRTACSSLYQTLARGRAFLRGWYADTQRFYQACGELAHKKHQLARLGDQSGTRQRVQDLQVQVGLLSSTAVSWFD